MLHEVFKLLAGNSFFEILLIAVFLDTTLGVLRAIKEHKFNSCVGIDGAIRKVAMLLSVGLLISSCISMSYLWFRTNIFNCWVFKKWEYANFSVYCLYYMRQLVS